jgi:hypothetical protein
MEVSELYHWIEDDPTHGLILRITDSEIRMLKQGKKIIMGLDIDSLEEVCDLIDKISEVKDGRN